MSERTKAIDDLYAVFAPDVVLEAEVEDILARIVAIDCEARGEAAAAAFDVDRLTIAWHRVEGHITPARLAAAYAALRDEGETT